jgi:hypothetical protein
MSFEYTNRESQVRAELHKDAIKTLSFTSCLNCSNWVEDKGCELYKAMPPPHIIVFGCDKHQFDIPF